MNKEVRGQAFTFQSAEATYNYVPATDIQLFVANPLEEERRGWNDVFVRHFSAFFCLAHLA
jgi:hypothetical protein